MALPAVAELNDILATVPINGDYNLQAPAACITQVEGGGSVRCQLLTNGGPNDVTDKKDQTSGILMDFRVPSR